MHISPRKFTRKSGFSLIEVVIAIGLVALVMVPVVALLGTAIDTSREAFAQVNDARIGAELVGELQQAEWDDLASWNGRKIYYDYQGQRLPDGTQEDAVFTAQIQVKGSLGGLGLGTTAPAGNPFLRQVIVAISSRPGEAGSLAIERALSDSSGSNRGVHIVRSVVVNADR